MGELETGWAFAKYFMVNTTITILVGAMMGWTMLCWTFGALSLADLSCVVWCHFCPIRRYRITRNNYTKKKKYRKQTNASSVAESTG